MTVATHLEEIDSLFAGSACEVDEVFDVSL